MGDRLGLAQTRAAFTRANDTNTHHAFSGSTFADSLRLSVSRAILRAEPALAGRADTFAKGPAK